MANNALQILRSNTALARPTGDAAKAGAPYWNEADQRFGVIALDGTTPIDLGWPEPPADDLTYARTRGSAIGALGGWVPLSPLRAFNALTLNLDPAGDAVPDDPIGDSVGSGDPFDGLSSMNIWLTNNVASIAALTVNAVAGTYIASLALNNTIPASVGYTHISGAGDGVTIFDHDDQLHGNGTIDFTDLTMNSVEQVLAAGGNRGFYGTVSMANSALGAVITMAAQFQVKSDATLNLTGRSNSPPAAKILTIRTGSIGFVGTRATLNIINEAGATANEAMRLENSSLSLSTDATVNITSVTGGSIALNLVGSAFVYYGVATGYTLNLDWLYDAASTIEPPADGLTYARSRTLSEERGVWNEVSPVINAGSINVNVALTGVPVPVDPQPDDQVLGDPFDNINSVMNWFRANYANVDSMTVNVAVGTYPAHAWDSFAAPNGLRGLNIVGTDMATTVYNTTGFYQLRGNALLQEISWISDAVVMDATEGNLKISGEVYIERTTAGKAIGGQRIELAANAILTVVGASSANFNAHRGVVETPRGGAGIELFNNTILNITDNTADANSSNLLVAGGLVAIHNTVQINMLGAQDTIRLVGAAWDREGVAPTGTFSFVGDQANVEECPDDGLAYYRTRAAGALGAWVAFTP